MRLGPIFIGWRLLSSAELSEFELPNDRPWQGWCVEWFGPEYRTGFCLLVRPVIARGYA